MAAPSLLRLARDRSAKFALALFAVAAVFLLAMSGAYHWVEPGTTAKVVLRRLDHAGIWALIGSTFAAVHIIAFRGFWRWAILAPVAVVTIASLVLEVVFFSYVSDWLRIAMYLSIGWIGALSGRELGRRGLHREMWLLVAGGVAYSAGIVAQVVLEGLGTPIVIPYVIRAHELLHVAVVVGVVMHWRCVGMLATGADPSALCDTLGVDDAGVEARIGNRPMVGDELA